MKYTPNNLSIFLDISTFCNAACPQCHRTNPNGLDKADWLPLVQWDLQAFKNAYKLENLNGTQRNNMYRQFEFCGTWGDPVMNKDLLKMVKYIKDNTNARIVIDTNGSIRDEDWWWELGSIAGKRLTVYFAVDGIDQKMHSHYRRNTNLDKVLSNMKSISNTLSIIKARTIVFKHNEDCLDDIKDMVKKHGARSIVFTPSDRWSQGPTFNFVDADGIPQKLERSRILNEHKVQMDAR